MKGKHMKRVLATGGAGFVGSHLCEHLLDAEHDMLCMDNFYIGTKGNIAHLLGSPNFKVNDSPLCRGRRALQLDLPALAHPLPDQPSADHQGQYARHSTINMPGLAKRVKAKILQTSTSEVYGAPVMHPQVESYWGNINLKERSSTCVAERIYDT